jgi:hypothetical protein
MYHHVLNYFAVFLKFCRSDTTVTLVSVILYIVGCIETLVCFWVTWYSMQEAMFLKCLRQLRTPIQTSQVVAPKVTYLLTHFVQSPT